jgi:hypothetical protein
MTQLQTVASTGTPLSIADTTAGELFITDYDATTGEVDYRYVLDTAITDVDQLAVLEQEVFDIKVSDDGGVSYSPPGTVTVTIHDDVPDDE